MAAFKVTVLLLVLVYSCSASNNNLASLSNGFPINSLLTCNVPFQTRSGIMAVPESPFSAPLLGSGTPKSSDYRLPAGQLDEIALEIFLGVDYDQNLTSIEARTGNAGSTRLSDPIPIGGEFGPAETTAIRNFLDRQNAGSCTFTRVWQQLDATFFPRYYASGTCSGGNSCSVPAGLRCQLDLSARISAFALRWDCCNTYIARSNRYAFQCGWRRVLIPFVDGCRCAC